MSKSKDQLRLERYIENVQSGALVSCLMVRKAVDRFVADMGRADLRFDAKEFDRFCSFSRQFKHYKGAMAGQFFEPEDWQLFIIANVIGLKRTNGRRKYRLVDVYVPRKNGKTMFAAIFALWFLIMDGEGGAEVYTAALDKDQARLSYDAAATLIQGSIFAPLVYVRNSRASMECKANHGVCKPFSKDTKNKDGLNIHAAICDERHAWPNTEMLDVIKTGMGARLQPVIMSISTAGTDCSNPYFADIEAYKEEMLGVRPMEDDHFFMLYCPDEGDDWESEETWKKVNPNYGVSLDFTYMKATYDEAKIRGGSYTVAFQTKNLNMWVDAPDVWLSDDDVVANNAPFDRSRLEGQECWVGIDLASKTDITAVSFFFPRLKVVDYLFVVPQAKLEGNEDRVDYRAWKEQGWLTVCPGKVLDEDWFVTTLLQRLDRYKVKAIAYDPWGMWNITQKFGRYESALMEFQQSIRYMSVPTKWVESSVLRHEFNFLDNPVIRWMFRNVVVYVDPNANIKLDKSRSRNKIDGVVALVDAVGAWLNQTSGKTGEIYQTHTLRTISL